MLDALRTYSLSFLFLWVVSCVIISEAQNEIRTNSTEYPNIEVGVTKENDLNSSLIDLQENEINNLPPDKGIPSSNEFNINTHEHNNYTEQFFPSLTFNYTNKVDKCLTDYSFLNGFIRKVVLTFYYFTAMKKLEGEKFKRNSNLAWLVEHSDTEVNLSVNMTSFDRKPNKVVSYGTHPGQFVGYLHYSNESWGSFEVNNTLDGSNTYRLVDILKKENNGTFPIKECICSFVIETQRNIGLNTTSIETCEEKIKDIILAMKSNPKTEFDLTQTSLDRYPSRLVIPDNIKNTRISRRWRESAVEGEELVLNYNANSKMFSLVNTTNNGIDAVRQLLHEFRYSERDVHLLEIDEGSGQSPDYFDSREVNGRSCVYFPFDQGKCGGCYALVVSSSISISHCVQVSVLSAPLSPQQIIDCSLSFGNLGCDGGFYSNGWSYLLENNNPRNLLCSWEEYPYINSQRACQANKCNGCLTVGKYNIFTGLSLTGNDGWEFVTIVLPKVGSISLSINSNLPGFSSYSGGIYKAPKCTLPSELDHAVIMVGFGVSDDGEKYYVIQNSWGASWGISGFMNVSASSCDMFWHPGIIRQFPQDPFPKVCDENTLLLAGPGRAYKSGSSKIKQSIVYINIFLLIIILLFICM